jgi:hypothetical protein
LKVDIDRLRVRKDIDGGCKKFCVNGHFAGNCTIARSNDDRREEAPASRIN